MGEECVCDGQTQRHATRLLILHTQRMDEGMLQDKEKKRGALGEL